MNNNQGEVRNGLAHLKCIDISWIWKVFSRLDKFLIRAVVKIMAIFYCRPKRWRMVLW